MMTQSEISKRIRAIVQEQMVKHDISYEDVKATYDEHRELVRQASKAVNEQYGETFEKLGNPITNAKDMLRKSMSENGRTAEDVRRDLEEA